MLQQLRRKFVRYIYADQNSNSAVRSALTKLIKELEQKNGVALNVGAGKTHIDPRVKNLDIVPGEHIDYVGSATDLPLENNEFDLVITQEVLEHVDDPFKAMQEIYRVLKPGGKLYCQLPFVIGYHPGPTDYWRFTKEGIEQLVRSKGFTILECGITVGGGSGFYRIAVEFYAILFSIPAPFAYRLAKGFFSLILYPMKFLDLLFHLSAQKDRIPGGYYVIAQKAPL